MADPVRFSHLRAYGRSAMHGHHAITTEAEQTRDMERGTAVHALLFGNRRVLGWAGAKRAGKDFDAFVADNPDAEILTGSEHARALAIAAAVRANPLAWGHLQGDVEQTLYFDFYTKCRTTPDVRGADFVTELKTTNSADPSRFQWHALRMHYHAQLAFQMMGCGANGHGIDHAYIVAVETTEPFPVTVFEVTPRALEAGEKLCYLWMERLINCEASGVFPSYAQSVLPLDIPDDVELEFGEDDAG